MIMKDEALQSLIGGVGWSVKGDTVIYHADAPREPSDEEITTEMARLEAEYDAQEYARNRQAEYPTIADLVVSLYDTDDKSAIEAKRASVKAKYPKPE